MLYLHLSVQYILWNIVLIEHKINIIFNTILKYEINFKVNENKDMVILKIIIFEEKR